MNGSTALHASPPSPVNSTGISDRLKNALQAHERTARESREQVIQEGGDPAIVEALSNTTLIASRILVLATKEQKLAALQYHHTLSPMQKKGADGLFRAVLHITNKSSSLATKKAFDYVLEVEGKNRLAESNILRLACEQTALKFIKA